VIQDLGAGISRKGHFDEAGRMMRLWTAKYGMDIGDEGSVRDFSGDLRISRAARSGRQMPEATATASRCRFRSA